ncbi:MAG: FeoB-associated Cys-rich membrane protein [Anaerococcus sp.]|uniref:FeoB-associated Cys-rich membrane protein n=1 Tax=Anaerococcus sp. TaxID=1872515 RepID=UPI00262A8C9C|nr:FeoB-associated Cys-rich membrane protein [Anaerococcus sp.]MCI5971860.1 FeoB-associated Cys-rich membrane protein [Anaerococcus sp.]
MNTQSIVLLIAILASVSFVVYKRYIKSNAKAGCADCPTGHGNNHKNTPSCGCGCGS